MPSLLVSARPLVSLNIIDSSLLCPSFSATVNPPLLPPSPVPSPLPLLGLCRRVEGLYQRSHSLGEGRRGEALAGNTEGVAGSVHVGSVQAVEELRGGEEGREGEGREGEGREGEGREGEGREGEGGRESRDGEEIQRGGYGRRGVIRCFGGEERRSSGQGRVAGRWTDPS